MPVMDGIEFIKKLRTGDEVNKSTPIILITAFKPELDEAGGCVGRCFLFNKTCKE
jgi:CheY-like chemotaxis protein